MTPPSRERKRRGWWHVAGVLLALWSSATWAAGNVELGGMYYDLTNGYGHWDGVYARGVWGKGTGTVWNWETDSASEFGQHENYGVLGVTQTFSPRWYGYLSVGGSTNSDVVPQGRVDASVSYKALPGASLVSTVGYTGIRYRDGHRDQSGWLNVSAYLPHAVILMAGHSWMVSNPGAVSAQRSFVAVTYGHDGQRYITLRYGWGTEAYLPIGADVALVNFRSESASLTLRQWLGRRWGLNFYVDDFRNPYYQQYGGTLGAFYDF